MHATEFVESYFDAWNHHDPKSVADHLSSDGTYLDVPNNQQHSHDEFIDYLEDFFSQFHHRYELIGEILKSEKTIAFQYRMIPPGNHGKHEMSASYHGAEFVTWNGDAAMAIADYYDIPVNSLVNKYAKSGLTGDQLKRHKQRLNQIMRFRKVYLRPDLTLPKLAELTGCSVNHLSQVINSGFGTSFFDFLNRYRIEYARELLAKPDSQDMAILEIAFNAGFNSNSAFYSAFKKRVGISPAQFRKRRLKKHPLAL